MPVIAVVGSVADDVSPVYTQGVTAVFTTNTQPVPFEIAAANTGRNLAFTVENIRRIIAAIK